MAMQEGASRMAELEAQTRKMAQELAEYTAESTELRNQDHTVRRLEERVRSLEAELQEKVTTVARKLMSQQSQPALPQEGNFACFHLGMYST